MGEVLKFDVFLFCFLICATKLKTEVDFFNIHNVFLWRGGEGQWETLHNHHMPLN